MVFQPASIKMLRASFRIEGILVSVAACLLVSPTDRRFVESIRKKGCWREHSRQGSIVDCKSTAFSTVDSVEEDGALE